MKIRSYLSFMERILQWVWYGKYHILTCLSALLTLTYLLGWINFYPKVISITLVTIGLFTILKQQLLDAREFANNKPNTFRNWIQAFPSLRTITISVNLASSMTLSGKLQATSKLPDNANLEQKVDFLFRQIVNLQTKIQSIDDQLDGIQVSVKEESQKLKTEISKIDDLLKQLIANHAIGNYDLNLMGVVFTICGTLIQTFCL